MENKVVFLFNLSFDEYLRDRIIPDFYIIAPPRATHMSSAHLFSLGYVGLYLNIKRFNKYSQIKIKTLVQRIRTKFYMENL